MSNPWKSTYNPPSVRVTSCGVNDGVEIGVYNMVKTVVNWLHSALTNTWDIAREGIKVLNLVFPSQLALEVIKDWEVNDFTMEDKKFWAVQFFIFGQRCEPIPLPKIELSENFWTSVFAPLNLAIPGSQNLLFVDPDDSSLKFGYQFDPVRYYHILSDGLKDVKQVALVLALVWLLGKLGLFKAAKWILKSAWTFITKKGWKRDIDDTNDKISFMFDDLFYSGEDMNEVLDRHEENLAKLASKVGLRMVLR